MQYSKLERIELDLDLISELYIDKFNEKIQKLEDKQVHGVKLKALKEYGTNIFIKIKREGIKDDPLFIENLENRYEISISENWTASIENFKICHTDFESILHNINIVSSLSNEILEEIKNELSQTAITADDIEHYIKEVNKNKFQELNEPIKIYRTKDNNSDKIPIELDYKNKIIYNAVLEQGILKNIKISIKNIDYNALNTDIQNANNILKAFQYYVYYKNNKNEGYRIKYKSTLNDIE